MELKHKTRPHSQNITFKFVKSGSKRNHYFSYKVSWGKVRMEGWRAVTEVSFLLLFLHQLRFSKRGSWPVASASVGNLLEMQIHGLHSQATEPETLEVEAQPSVFTSPPGGDDGAKVWELLVQRTKERWRHWLSYLYSFLLKVLAALGLSIFGKNTWKQYLICWSGLSTIWDVRQTSQNSGRDL